MDNFEGWTREDLVREISRLREKCEHGEELNAVTLSEQRFRSFVENTRDALFCYEHRQPIPTDLPIAEQIVFLYDEVLVECNLNFVRFCGFETPEQVLGKTLRQIFPDLEPGGEVDDLFRRYIENGYRTVNEPGVDRYPDGSVRYTLHSTQGEVVDGRLVRSWGAFHDITAFRKMQERMEAKGRLESLGRVSKGIAHDFKNLLAVISMGCEFILESTEDSEVVESVQDIQGAGERAKNLIGRINEFTDVSSDELAPVRVPPIVESMVDLLRNSILQDVAVQTEIDAGCREVFGSTTRVEQLLMNLITNACRAMAEVDADLKLTVREQNVIGRPGVSGGDFVELLVEDNGCGIEQEDLGRIFEPYYSTKAPGHGSGFGLAVVHGVVTELGGFIEVESQVGVGARFRVGLPVHGG